MDSWELSSSGPQEKKQRRQGHRPVRGHSRSAQPGKDYTYPDGAHYTIKSVKLLIKISFNASSARRKSLLTVPASRSPLMPLWHAPLNIPGHARNTTSDMAPAMPHCWSLVTVDALEPMARLSQACPMPALRAQKAGTALGVAGRLPGAVHGDGVGAKTGLLRYGLALLAFSDTKLRCHDAVVVCAGSKKDDTRAPY